jgi:hypothetical protein
MEVINPAEIVDSFEFDTFNSSEINYKLLSINSFLVSNDINKLREDLFKEISKKELLDKIKNAKLSKNIINIASEYDKIFGYRNKFLWQFMQAIFNEKGIVLSSVDDEYYDSTVDSKIMLTILVCILDDVIDVEQDISLLDKMIGLLKFDNEVSDNIKDNKLILVKRIWNEFLGIIKQFPRYKEFKDIFNYDFTQMINGLHYSYLVNKNPNMINLTEMHNYDCHNMIVFLMNGIDLMASSTFKIDELPHIRKVFWHAQQMARIGNWLSTWKREVKEKDISSGVFAYVFSNKIMEISDIVKMEDEEIIQIIQKSGVDNYFFNIWKLNLEQLKSLRKYISSVDMESYIAGFEKVLQYHMATEGFK